MDLKYLKYLNYFCTSIVLAVLGGLRVLTPCTAEETGAATFFCPAATAVDCRIQIQEMSASCDLKFGHILACVSFTEVKRLIV